MKFPKPYSLQEIAFLLNCTFVGDANLQILGMNEIHVVTEGDIVFVDQPKYYEKALKSLATTILIDQEVPCPPNKALLISSDPFRDFNKLALYFQKFSPSCVPISPSAQIGLNTIIQPNCYIGHHVRIGENCIIHANVSIYDHVKIGNNVIIHSGSVIGADAFYYKKYSNERRKFISCGSVVIEDNVEIGSLSSIDRGVTSDTRIGFGTKIDNQVQIGHDTHIGQNCLIAAQAGIAGCTIIEDEVTLWGQVGVKSNVRIGKKAVIMGQTSVTKSVPGEKSYWGSPIQEFNVYLKQLARLKKMISHFNKNNML